MLNSWKGKAVYTGRHRLCLVLGVLGVLRIFVKQRDVGFCCGGAWKCILGSRRGRWRFEESKGFEASRVDDREGG